MQEVKHRKFESITFNKPWLRENKFRPSQIYPGAYSKSFPVYCGGDSISFSCEVVVFQDGSVKVDVLDTGTRSRFAQFYVEEDEDNVIMQIINRKIEKELTNLGIKEIKD